MSATSPVIPGVSQEPMRWWHIDQCAQLDRMHFPDSAWSSEMFWAELARVRQTRYYVVATESGAVNSTGDQVVIGYAGLAAMAPEADVQTIAVAESARGIGLGRTLLNDLLREARDRGCSTVLLEVAEDNPVAIELYLSCGFETISTRKDYYAPGRSALIMRRREGSND